MAYVNNNAVRLSYCTLPCAPMRMHTTDIYVLNLQINLIFPNESFHPDRITVRENNFGQFQTNL